MGLASYEASDLKSVRKREFPMHYQRGKTLFQIVVRSSDKPGSLSSVLEILAPKVNLVAISTYTLGDGTAMFSSFAEPLSKDVTPAGLQTALGGSPATIEADVREGRGGLLVDTFHSGLVVGNEDFMMLRRGGLSGVFDHIVKTFGTGGELLLFEEGMAMAQRNAQRTSAALSLGVIKENLPYLIKFLSAQGWGMFASRSGKQDKEFTVQVRDCFECAHGSAVRRHCDFLRGYFEGSGGVTFGVPMKAEEADCVLRGGEECVFHISQRKQKSGMTEARGPGQTDAFS